MTDDPIFFDLKSKLSKKEYFSDYYNEDDKVLEFGCGVGQNLVNIKNKYGFDINKELYPMLESKGIKMFKTIDEIPSNFFDQILLCQVLEHLENPIEILTKLKDKLKVNGYIRIVVPKVHHSEVTDMNYSIDGHIYGWGFYELNYLLNLVGFTNIFNKKVYSKGTERFYPIYKFGFFPYYLMIKLFGRIVDNFDTFVIARK
jgi:SAM-dependent methyltransferase